VHLSACGGRKTLVPPGAVSPALFGGLLKQYGAEALRNIRGTMEDQNGAAVRPIKALHIEDDPGFARAVARLLRIQGYEVTSAASGSEAVQVVENGLVPDVILADYHLPLEMTGDQVVAEIVERLGFRPPTIILASVESPNVEKVMAVADRIFDKPVDMLLVIHEIQHLLLRRYGR
jgi:CheY-like chemotaxis protein